LLRLAYFPPILPPLLNPIVKCSGPPKTTFGAQCLEYVLLQTPHVWSH
jgi:hypothetical protein